MRRGGVILLVEDDEVDIQAVKRAFKQHRVANTLHVTRDGEQALSYLRNEGEYADREKAPPPSLILLDLRMPRMDGLELLRILKADPDFRVIPVVIFTSSREDVDIVNSYANGASSYLVKPVTFEKLLEAIKTFDLYWTLSELPGVE